MNVLGTSRRRQRLDCPFWLLATVVVVVTTCCSVQAFSPTTNNKHLNRVRPSASSTSLSMMEQHRDIVIVGGGLAGLSAAFYLKTQVDPSRHVTILDSQEAGPASLAAAGMLAPHSERLPAGPLLDLCCASREMYREFVQHVEQIAKQSGTEGQKYLQNNNKGSGSLEPWQVGYVSSGGFLAPAMAGDSVATWAPPETSEGVTAATWLDATQVRELEPALHPSISGGWWFPEDASVDARRLTNCLRAACVGLGVQLLFEDGHKVTSLDLLSGKCQGVWCQNGMYMHCKTLLVANGAWMRQLLPVPMEPHKGQSLSLRMPPNQPPILRRVLFAQDSYICPKPDGRIVIGSTVEAGSFDPNVTPAGLMHILHHAIQLVPALASLPLEESWVGLRPTTPDKGPILGATPWSNVFCAGGYWRNGVLLAPKTGQLVATLLAGTQPSEEQDQEFLEAFAWNRFTTSRSSSLLNANARYAASMHPVHTRATGVGIAASVGTELGSYSTARSAQEERKRDRESLFSSSGDAAMDARFEQAAALGKQDAQVYTGFDNKYDRTKNDYDDSDDATTATTQAFEGSADAFTVGSSSSSSSTAKANKKVDSSSEEGGSSSSLDNVYKFIRTNKKQQQQSSYLVDDDDDDDEQRPDPGFRIYHVDESSGKKREVPPYTTPGDFLASLKKEEQPRAPVETPTQSVHKDEPTTVTETEDLASVYQSIRANKQQQQQQSQQSNEKTWAQLLLESDDDDDDRPDPGFRIYHVDSETGEQRVVPPYTSPGDFLQQLQKEKQQSQTPQASKDTTHDVSANGDSAKPKANGTEEQAYSEQTFDGYTVIQQANSRSSRQEELEAMRKARRQNRLEDTDVKKIGLVEDWDAI